MELKLHETLSKKRMSRIDNKVSNASGEKHGKRYRRGTYTSSGARRGLHTHKVHSFGTHQERLNLSKRETL